MKPIIIIPARMASSRLPKKPLADIGGKPMILRVLEKAWEADIGPVLVACDDEQVADVVKAAGGDFCMTDPDLPSGSDRVYCALEIFDPKKSFDIIINLQGDSPTTEASSIRAALKGLRDTNFDICTLAFKTNKLEDINDESICKIAIGGFDKDDIRRAMHFSRNMIPANAKEFYYHIGLYAYHRSALKRFVHHPPTSLEQLESLEQLRALELDLKIGVACVDTFPCEVNTPEDLIKVQRYF